jgi:flagellar biosynthetic protein FliQ
MSFDQNIESLRLAFWQIVLAAGPILGIALAVGLVIGVLQAATSINEMTLSFVPKLVLVLGAMALLSGFMMGEMTDYFAFIFDTIAGLN